MKVNVAKSKVTLYEREESRISISYCHQAELARWQIISAWKEGQRAFPLFCPRTFIILGPKLLYMPFSGVSSASIIYNFILAVPFTVFFVLFVCRCAQHCLCLPEGEDSYHSCGSLRQWKVLHRSWHWQLWRSIFWNWTFRIVKHR